MKKVKNYRSVRAIVCLCLTLSIFIVNFGANAQITQAAKEHDHNEHLQAKDADFKAENNPIEQPSHGDHAQESENISLSAESMALVNIAVNTLTAKTYQKSIYAPGEIKANGYTSYVVSARTESVVLKRHAILGQHISKGQALVTLFSESVAKAQATYRVAYTEWQRNKKLDKNTISDSRLLRSETNYIEAYSKLEAFGLTEQAINKIVENSSSSLGEYTLIAQRSGAVLSDNFAQGKRVSAGDEIMLLADESELWVEARISPNKQLSLPVGTEALLTLGTAALGKETFTAKVIQEAHTIDPITRTRIIRLSVKNENDRLHPGMFVDVNFLFKTEQPVLAVAETALIRSSDGDWTVFVEQHPGEFRAVEVELGQFLGIYREIIGLAENTRVVTQGAFFVASELAKGGFDPHNH